MVASANIQDREEGFELDVRNRTLYVRAFGNWTLSTIKALDQKFSAALVGLDYDNVTFDLSGVGRLDTSGAYILTRAVGALGEVDCEFTIVKASKANLILLNTAVEASAGIEPRRSRQWYDALSRMGMSVERVVHETIDTLAFLGKFVVILFKSIVTPGKIRWKSVVSQVEEIGVDALPIVAILSFFIGAVIAYMGTELLQQFGAQLFMADLVGITVLREFAVIITAILLAGRSDSAFTAQIGAMKMRQEIDAMTVMGIDTFDAIVIPRAIACLIAAPILVFVAMLTGLLGGMFVAWTAAEGVTSQLFLSRLTEVVGIKHFWIGMVKAPIFALVIAVIGCRQGLAVDGSVTSLGTRTTSAVVQAIFAVIFLDAVFALVFLKMGV